MPTIETQSVDGHERRIPELDGIRGIAILLVVSWHYFFSRLPDVTPGSFIAYTQLATRLTWTGVDLFFVLSGFLIGGILLDTRESPDYFRRFYRRRFFRIVPLYAVWFVVMVVLIARIPRKPMGEWLGVGGLPLWPFALYLQNFWMTMHNALGAYPTAITWSLAVEEQFYLTVPLLVRFCSRKWLTRVVVAGIGVAPLLRVLVYYVFPANRIGLFALMPCRADALLFGVLGAIAVRNGNCLTWLMRDRWKLPGIIFALALTVERLAKLRVAETDLHMAAWGYTAVAALYSCVLLFAIARRSWFSECLSWGWLRSIGKIAYGIYLTHILMLFAFTAVLFHERPRMTLDYAEVGIAGLAFLATLALCALSWCYLESPLIEIGRRWERLTGRRQNSPGPT